MKMGKKSDKWKLQNILLQYIKNEKVLIPKGVRIRPDLLHILLKDEHLPEKKLRFAWVIRLIENYGFSSEQIEVDFPVKIGSEIENSTADILVFRDTNHKEPFILINTAQKLTKDFIEKSKKMAYRIGTEFLICSSPAENNYYKINRYDLSLEKVEDIPYWVGTEPLIKKIPKSKILPPFRDEYSFKNTIFKCHTIIYENLAHDPSRAFDELIKILFLKIFDELETKDYYRFVVLAGERPEDVGNRLRELFKEAISNPKFKKIFNDVSHVDIELDNFTIYQVVRELQGYSLVKTTEIIEGSDIKGRVYEQILDRTFRGGLGQYYTPRTIAKFMVEFLDPSENDKILDPACGTGGFFVMCIRHIIKKIKNENPQITKEELSLRVRRFIENKIFGIDIVDRACRAARMNLLMHGGEEFHIFNTNGLLIDENLPKEIKEIFKENSFDHIFSNPPFAGYFKDPEILKKFDLGKVNGKIRSVTREVLFIEKIIKLLRYGGKAGLVLPLGIFNNPSLKYVRNYIFKHTKVLGIIGLPGYAFTHTGTSVKGALLFLEKVKEPPKDYKIFIAIAEKIGYDSTGREILENDFDKIIEAYRNKENGYFISFSQIKDRIDPEYYHPNYRLMIERIKKSKYPLKPLSELVEFSRKRINPEKEPNKKFKYIETNCVDLKEGKIVEIKEFVGRNAPSRARLVGGAGDFLIPTAAESLVGVAILPPEYDGIIVSNRFIVVKPKSFVNPDYLYYLLRSKPILQLLKRESTGEIVLSINEKSFENILVPLPSYEEQEKIIKKIRDKREKIERLKIEIEELKKQIIEEFEQSVFYHFL